MSGDGSIIVGTSSTGGNAFIWQKGVGMMSAGSYLSIPNINYIGAVSDDGHTFAGTTSDGKTFVAFVPEPGASLSLLVCSVAILGARRRLGIVGR
jgi:hypothetical protein